MPTISTVCGTHALDRALTIIAGSRGGAGSCVMHPALDKAELDRGQRDDDRHQHRRLRRRAAEVEPDDAVVPDLVDEDFGRLRRAALGYVVDDAERVEKRVDDVDDD